MRRILVAFLGSLVLMAACKSRAAPEHEPEVSREPAVAPSPSGTPWQPPGLRTSPVACQFDAPVGLDRVASPMPSHIAEFMSPGMPPAATTILSARVERTIAAARKGVLTYYRAALEGNSASLARDDALDGGAAPAHVIRVHTGEADNRREELIVLLSFPGDHVVEVVARFPENDDKTRQSVLAFARALRCTEHSGATVVPGH